MNSTVSIPIALAEIVPCLCLVLEYKYSMAIDVRAPQSQNERKKEQLILLKTLGHHFYTIVKILKHWKILFHRYLVLEYKYRMANWCQSPSQPFTILVQGRQSWREWVKKYVSTWTPYFPLTHNCLWKVFVYAQQSFCRAIKIVPARPMPLFRVPEVLWVLHRSQIISQDDRLHHRYS